MFGRQLPEPMNDLQAILEVFQVASQRGELTFLVTVVHTQGSTYRRPGARMLITQSGEITGMVSGGCLEQDILEQTRKQSDEAFVVTYNSTAENEDILWGLGLGCNGVVQVLIESLLPDDCNPLTVLAECWRDRSPAVLASIFQTEAPIVKTAVRLGACLALTPDKVVVFDQPHADLIAEIGADAQAVLQQQQSTLKSYDLAAGTVQVFLEFIPSPTVLVIFGAGQDAIPVMQMAKSLGWQVTVADCRANPVSHERFALADQVVLTRRERLPQFHPLSHQPSAAVVMTHNYLDDLEVLRTLLPSSVSYIGVLGPKRRTERLLQDLQIETNYSNTQLEKLHAPVGLDIGADTPEAIAVSIVAEIQAVLAQRTGGFLRHRSMPIHQ